MVDISSVIKYFKVLLIPIGATIFIPLLLSIVNLIGLKTSNLLILIMMSIVMIISGFFLGKKSNKNGYLKGIIFGLITILLFFIISLIFKNEYKISTIIYYTILVVSSTVGSMFGIQNKTNGK